MTRVINEEVNVNAFYFVGKDIKTFPRQIEFGGRAITFADGLRLQLRRSGEPMYFFDMSATDGSTYRLQQNGNQWKLVGTL